MSNAPPPAADADWARFQPWRPWLEWGFWIGLFLVNSIANSITVDLDLRRVQVDVRGWEPVVWEFSSNFVALLLVPAIVAFTRWRPLEFSTWRRRLAEYLLASVVWSALHVAGMVAIRKAVYAALGAHYDFGDWVSEWGYEYLKDARGFASSVLIVEAYRLFLRRLQGEARLLSAPDDAPAAEPVARPERFLVRKLGKEFLVAAADIEWLQASGNYVNLHVRGRDYPLRCTMAQIEEKLDPARFRRVHRSWVVNLDVIDRIEPVDSGDARVVMQDGTAVPCSRRYRSALRGEATAAA
ncbi:LytTR family DNA-binding domain-containing protein [Cognatilysobacter lacus]|uniref:LytTR family transcriptional regulator n=1 Tax=Cognatilysobacter lacus TaxID=1643323 RepID=A0A5D8YYB3_9GAMM|nr:LytTR family DNA-binding domain-containing protein [Lysobacter lacus]TZF87471.1 LytTR family transcriptional regulator [Lysobacter lacus]